MKVFLKRSYVALAILFSLILSSCGYVSDRPLDNTEIYKTDELQSCKIDINKLGEIFKSDQKDQIRCLQENFIQFTKYVRSNQPGTITESEMTSFIKKFFEGQSDSIIKGLSLIFQLNMLLLKDEADKISRTNISPLFELLVRVNQEAITITEVLKEMSEEKNQGRFFELRAKFNASINRFADFTVKIIEKSQGTNKKLNIKTFILDASKKLGSKEIDEDTIDSLIFLKRILVAGDKEIISTDELKTLVTKLPKLLQLSFDLYFVTDKNFSNDYEHMRFHLNNTRDLYNVIEFRQEDFKLFTIDQILKLVQEFNKDINVTKFKPSIVSLKSRLVGGDKEFFSLKDFKTCLDIANDFIERRYFNTITYDTLRPTLEYLEAGADKTKPITSLPPISLPVQYDVFSQRRLNELHQDFANSAIQLRYFRNKNDGVAFYGSEFYRTKYGFLESLLMKWGAVKLLTGYGHKNKNGQLQVTLQEFQTFLFEMRPILEEFHLWSPNPDTFARNAILLADLFQNKSNGDLEVNVNEATEYIGMILSAVQLTDTFSAKLSERCEGGINKDEPIFNTNCFNQNFFDVLLKQANYKRYFPRLYQYTQTATVEELQSYLTGVEGFARDVNDPKIPIGSRDSILILGAMINVESTFIRFDSNRDNIIDYKELVASFEIYKNAIISIAKLRPEQEAYALSIFLYMVSKMEVPPTGKWIDNLKFITFHSCVTTSWCRDTMLDPIVAKRLNVGKLLYYLVNQPTAEVRGKFND